MEETKAKAEELVQGLSQETGVNPEDVQKILSHLGLETALENRLSKEQLQNVSLTSLRIAAGERQI